MQWDQPNKRSSAGSAVTKSRGKGLKTTSRLMPLLSGLLVLFLAMYVPVGVRADAGGTLAVVRAKGASLCEAPGGDPIQALAKGTALEATGRTAGSEWVTVTSTEGVIGWVRTEQLVLFGLDYLPVVSDWVEPAAATSPLNTTKSATTASVEVVSSGEDIHLEGTVTATNSRLNIRSGPGTDYSIVDRAQAGEHLTALARNAASDWIQVERPDLPGDFGWVSGRYLSLDGDPADLPVSGTISDAPALITARLASGTATGLTGKLVFQTRSGGTIYVYDLTSGDLRPLTAGADPAISPDGQTVAFWRDEGGQHGLYLVNVDGGGEQRILTRGELLRAPSWSPDGKSIVFSRVIGQGACRDAGHSICLPDTFPYNQMFPLKTFDVWGLSSIDRRGDGFRDLAAMSSAFSPDWGERGIVYHSDAGIQVTQDNGNDDENVLLLGNYRYQDPAWQPGGARIAFQSLEKDHWEIFTANADGSNPVALTRPATTLVPKLPHNVAPAWSPDGQAIVFLSNRSGDWAFWVMDASGGNQHQLPIDVPIEYHYQTEQVVSWGLN